MHLAQRLKNCPLATVKLASYLIGQAVLLDIGDEDSFANHFVGAFNDHDSESFGGLKVRETF
jgi:hypothetical protein